MSNMHERGVFTRHGVSVKDHVDIHLDEQYDFVKRLVIHK